MRLRRINAWNIEINEKTPVFNLYLSPLWVFVPLAQTWQAMLSHII